MIDYTTTGGKHRDTPPARRWRRLTGQLTADLLAMNPDASPALARVTSELEAGRITRTLMALELA